VFPALERFVNQQTWLDTVGDPLQKTIGSLFTRGGDTGKQAKNLLNGTWLGHPAHPAITDVPMGAWTCTLVFDTMGLVADDPSLERAADIALGTGLLGAIGSAVTGLTDWSDTYGQERRVGLLHGLTMVCTVLTYTASLLVRRAGSRGTGVALGNVGYVLALAGAYLGGEEVADIGYGVNHTAFHHGPTDFVPVLPEAELQPDTPTKVDAKGVAVVLVKQQDQIYALDDTCVHAGCSLAGGHLEGRSIICPCHGSQYDLRGGSVINGPATMPEPHYDVRVQDGTIEVKQAQS
jgi:nitrite reductase/ring-hydroxylating ferredoxin subunit/uncharacterized membrane protein